MGVLKYVVRLISQNLGPISFGLYQAANLYTKSYMNVNHDMRTNGEFYLLDRLAGFNIQTVFDVGANKGEYTNACLTKFQAARIHAFEIVPETHARFISNVRSDRVVINNFGLADRPGDIEINYNPKKDGLSSLIEGTDINKGQWTTRGVEIRCGDEYCRANDIKSIDFLKMDVEGAENLVLLGLDDMLSSNRIKVIQFEFGMINIYSKFLLIDFWKVLEGHGFRLGPMMPKGVDFMEYNPRNENFQGPPNYVAVHSSRPDLIDAVRLK